MKLKLKKSLKRISLSY